MGKSVPLEAIFAYFSEPRSIKTHMLKILEKEVIAEIIVIQKCFDWLLVFQHGFSNS
jgi:hypothetical protein